MPLVDSFVWEDASIIDARDRQSTLSSFVNTEDEAIKTLKETALMQSKMVTVITNTNDITIATNVDEPFAEILRLTLADFSHTQRRNLERTQNDVTTRISYLQERRAELSAVNEILSGPLASSGAVTLTKAIVYEELKSLPNIDSRSIALGIDEIHGPYIRWVFKDVLMTPTQQENYPWLSSEFEQARIKLAPVVARFFVKTNRVTFSPRRGEAETHPYVWSGSRRVHPHVLDQDVPCLGDFVDPIVDAASKHDWNTLSTIMRLFLERSISNDTAGRQWVMYFLNHLNFSMSGVEGLNASQLGNRDSSFRYTFREVNAPGEYRISKYDREGSLVGTQLMNP